MDKTYRIELRRVFLLENLPEPLTRSSSHLQIFDNYIENTRLRLRSIRSPETKEWKWVLEQRFSLDGSGHWAVSEIYLDENEHGVFESFEGREIQKNERIQTNEIRKNRYFYESSGRQFEIDLFLGELWGLILAQINFQTAEEMRELEAPSFAVREVTGNEFFIGRNLVGKTFADVQGEFLR